MTANNMKNGRVRATMATFFVIAAYATGCSGSSSYIVAAGAQGRTPPTWEACSAPRSSAPNVVNVSGSSFSALAPGAATIQCTQRSLTMEVRAVARIKVDTFSRPLTARATLRLRAYDSRGTELALFDASAITWKIPEGLRRNEFCGHGNTYCDAERVLIVDAPPGNYRIPEGVRRNEFCGHGNTYCDAERVLSAC